MGPSRLVFVVSHRGSTSSLALPPLSRLLALSSVLLLALARSPAARARSLIRSAAMVRTVAAFAILTVSGTPAPSSQSMNGDLTHPVLTFTATAVSATDLSGLFKRQTLSGDSQAQVNGLLDLANKVLTDASSGNITSQCLSWSSALAVSIAYPPARCERKLTSFRTGRTVNPTPATRCRSPSALATATTCRR